MSAPRIPPPSTLVLGTELTANDARVADVTIELACGLGVPVVLVHAIALAEDDDPDRSEARVAHDALHERIAERDRIATEKLSLEADRLRARAEGRCPAITFRLVSQRPSAAVCDTTHGIGGAWAVVGAHPTRTRLGATADRVVRDSHAPVLVIPAEARIGSGGVLAAIDAGPLDERVLGVASMLARRLSTSLGLVHVREAPDGRALLRVNDHLRDIAPEVASSSTLSVMPRENGIARTIGDHGQRMKAKLIVAGSHGRRGAVRWILGSTAEELGRIATSPVLIAR